MAETTSNSIKLKEVIKGDGSITLIVGGSSMSTEEKKLELEAVVERLENKKVTEVEFSNAVNLIEGKFTYNHCKNNKKNMSLPTELQNEFKKIIEKLKTAHHVTKITFKNLDYTNTMIWALTKLIEERRYNLTVEINIEDILTRPSEGGAPELGGVPIHSPLPSEDDIKKLKKAIGKSEHNKKQIKKHKKKNNEEIWKRIVNFLLDHCNGIVTKELLKKNISKQLKTELINDFKAAGENELGGGGKGDIKKFFKKLRKVAEKISIDVYHNKKYEKIQSLKQRIEDHLGHPLVKPELEPEKGSSVGKHSESETILNKKVSTHKPTQEGRTSSTVEEKEVESSNPANTSTLKGTNDIPLTKMDSQTEIPFVKERHVPLAEVIIQNAVVVEDTNIKNNSEKRPLRKALSRLASFFRNLFSRGNRERSSSNTGAKVDVDVAEFRCYIFNSGKSLACKETKNPKSVKLNLKQQKKATKMTLKALGYKEPTRIQRFKRTVKKKYKRFATRRNRT